MNERTLIPVDVADIPRLDPKRVDGIIKLRARTEHFYGWWKRITYNGQPKRIEEEPFTVCARDMGELALALLVQPEGSEAHYFLIDEGQAENSASD